MARRHAFLKTLLADSEPPLFAAINTHHTSSIALPIALPEILANKIEPMLTRTFLSLSKQKAPPSNDERR